MMEYCHDTESCFKSMPQRNILQSIANKGKTWPIRWDNTFVLRLRQQKFDNDF